ncbi:MAG TPA: hypothetical protein PK390_04140 [Fervidobacterium nodosum]|nr:hypothetical protein [Fervidobacterium nodosum]
MNENGAEKCYSKLLKTFSINFSYKPGPMMEEKILKKIKRKKVIGIMYRFGIGVFLTLIILFFGTEELGWKYPKRVFSLFDLFREAAQKTIENPDISSFSLGINNNSNLNLLKKNLEDYLNNNNISQNGSDEIFKMIKYVSIANDGGW